MTILNVVYLLLTDREPSVEGRLLLPVVLRHLDVQWSGRPCNKHRSMEQVVEYIMYKGQRKDKVVDYTINKGQWNDKVVDYTINKGQRNELSGRLYNK